MSDMSENNNKVVIQCPRCDFQKGIDTVKNLNGSKEVWLKIKCRCGEIFKTFLEKQTFSSSEIITKGHVVIEDLSEIISGLSVSIRDLSMSGVRVETDYPDLFQVDSKVFIKIYCQSPEGSFISKDGTVVDINEKSIGINFTQNGPEWSYKYCSLESEEDKNNFDHYLYL